MDLTLKQMAINQMRLYMPIDVKQKYMDLIIEACKLNKWHIQIEVNSKDYENTKRWLEIEGLSVIKTHQDIDNISTVHVSWA